MASAAEIANDLRARAAQRRCLPDDARAMNRAAVMLDGQRSIIAELEEAAEFEAQKYENHFYGKDQHGTD